MIEVLPTPISDLVVIKPQVFGDARGYFLESYNEREWRSLGLNYDFIQDNQSFSSYGTLRGLHYQRGSHAQAKLVRALKGKILDVVVDLRENSPTFKKSFAIELSDENFLQLLVPRSFAHGFVVLSETALVAYKCDNVYSPANESGILASDPDLAIDWQVPVDRRLLSGKDKVLPTLQDVLKTKDWL